MSENRRVLLKGEEAIVLAAAIAGADLYGYPITPVTGVVEMAAALFPHVGRIFLQAESEVAAANMAYGASAVGQRVLCVSSSPGVSLKQEAISYMAGAELPGVFVNAMRGGPGLGNIGASQADYFQATRGGGHGDYYTPVFAPSTVAETFEMTLEAFNVADRYRTPVMVIIDGSIAQSTESVRLTAAAAKLVRHFEKPWAANGAVGRHKNVVTSFRLEPIEALENLNLDLQAKYDRIGRKLGGQAVATLLDDAEVLVVAYGSMAGLAEAAVRRVRERGLRAGLLRPRMLWPFPADAVRQAARGAKAVLVLEMSAGQMVEDVRLALGDAREVFFYGRMGGMVPGELEIIEQIEKVADAARKIAPADLAAGTTLLQSDHYVRRMPAAHRIDETPPIERNFRPAGADQSLVVGRAESVEDVPSHYCPGCGHGNLHQIIARAVDELGLREKMILIEPVGCSVVTYWDFDTVQAAHGRGMALATSVSRTRPDRVVLSYQGDGDLASIGMAETLHAASRGEDFVLVFVNNCIYGMTGGQMAPTSIPGLSTTTCSTGRDVADVGSPIDMCKLFSQLDGVTYLERVAIDSPGGLNKTARAVRQALKYQAEGVGGLKVVEVLSPCPVGWKMTPAESHKYVKEVVSKYFPPGKFKDVAAATDPQAAGKSDSAEPQAASDAGGCALSARRPVRKHPVAVPPEQVLDHADLHWVEVLKDDSECGSVTLSEAKSVTLSATKGLAGGEKSGILRGPKAAQNDTAPKSEIRNPKSEIISQLGLRIAGHGGQGIVLLSGLLAHAAVRGGLGISLLPSYGSAMRGGTCNCQLRISDSPIASPYVSSPDVLVAMNQPSFDKFASTVRPGGLLLCDSTLVTDTSAAELNEGVRLVAAPMAGLAAKLGNERMANIVAAGMLVGLLGRGLSGLLDPRSVRESIPEIFAHRPKLAAPNQAAFDAGVEHTGKLSPARA